MLEEQMGADRCEIEERDEPESNLHNWNLAMHCNFAYAAIFLTPISKIGPTLQI